MEITNIMEKIQETSAVIANNQFSNFPDNTEQLITPQMARDAGNTIAFQENENILFAHTSFVQWQYIKGFEVQALERPSSSVAPMGGEYLDQIKYTGNGSITLIMLPMNCKFELGNLADLAGVTVFSAKSNSFGKMMELYGDTVVSPLWFYPLNKNKKGVQYRANDGAQIQLGGVQGFTGWNDGCNYTYIAFNIRNQGWSPSLWINNKLIDSFTNNWSSLGSERIQNEHISTIDLYEEEAEVDWRRKSEVFISTMKSSKIVPGEDPDYSTLTYDGDWQTVVIKVPANATFTMEKGQSLGMSNMVITEVDEPNTGISFWPSFGQVITPAKYYDGLTNDIKEYYADGPFNENVSGTTKALENVESSSAKYTYIFWSTEYSTYQDSTPLPNVYINNQKVLEKAVWQDIIKGRKNWYVYKQNSIVDLAVDLSRNFGALNLDSFSKIYSNERRTQVWSKVMADTANQYWVSDGDSEVKGFWVNPGEKVHIDVSNASLDGYIGVIPELGTPAPGNQITYESFIKTGFDYDNGTNDYQNTPNIQFSIEYGETYSTIDFINTNQEGCWIAWQSKLQGVDLGNPQSIYVNGTNIYQNGSFTGVEVGSTLLNFMQEILYLRDQVNQMWATVNP